LLQFFGSHIFHMLDLQLKLANFPNKKSDRVFCAIFEYTVSLVKCGIL